MKQVALAHGKHPVLHDCWEGYPRDRIFVESPVQFGSAVHEKAADIAISDKDSPNTAFIIVECKKPTADLTYGNHGCRTDRLWN